MPENAQAILIQFRLGAQAATIEWSNDSGHTWHDQVACTPRDVLQAWFALVKLAHRNTTSIGAQE